MAPLPAKLGHWVIFFGAAMASSAPYAADLADAFPDTEFAARWEIAENPGKDAAWLQAQLFPAKPVAGGLVAKKVGAESFAVRYFDWKTEAPAVDEVREIVRERKKTKSDKVTYELMYKLRGTKPFAVPKNACRLDAVGGSSPEAKAEVDASMATDGSFARSYSYSCDLKKGPEPFKPPAALQVTPQSCVTEVERKEIEAAGDVKIKIETWELPGGDLIEVSSSDLDGERFKAIVGKVVADAKLQLSTQGKTRTAGKCAKADNAP